MQQEIVNKKKEIIDIFLKNGVLISSELLQEIDTYDQATSVFNILKTKSLADLAVVGVDLSKIFDESSTSKTKLQIPTPSKIKIIYTYKEDAKKREPQDFVDYFNNRYKSIEKFLKQRTELHNTISIGKIQNKQEKETIAIIGIVFEKQITKNGNLLLLVEDPTQK